MRRNRSCGLFVFAVAAILTGCGKRDEKMQASPPIAQQAPLPVTNFAPPARPIVPETPLLPETVAELQGSAETPVIAKEAGYLVHQVIKENATVAAGDLLFLLDPRPSHDGATTGAPINAGLVKIVAPAAGAVGRALHGPGDWIHANDELATVATIDPIEAQFSVPADFYDKNDFYFEQLIATPFASRPANIALIVPEGGPYPRRGVMASITRAPGGPAVVIDVQFPNPAAALRPGEFVKVRGVAP